MPKPLVFLSHITEEREVLDTCARAAGITAPRPDFDLVRERITTLEHYYTRYSRIEAAIHRILALLPQFRPAFMGKVPDGELLKEEEVPKYDVDALHRELNDLQELGLITREFGRSESTHFQGSRPGTYIDLALNVTPLYRRDVLPRIALP